MAAALKLASLIVLLAALVACGGSSNPCNVTVDITPTTASADPSAAPPGNQVQFSLKSSVSGNCPLIPAPQGTWATSDPSHTSITQQGLATCTTVLPAAVQATISNSATTTGRNATLTCQ